MLRLLFGSFLLLFFVGCAPRTPSPHLVDDLTPFLKQAPPPLAPNKQATLYRDLLAHRYAPWQMTELNATYAEATWAISHYRDKAIFGENLRPIPPDVYESWVRNARYDAYDTLKRHAVVTHPSALRLFPTHRPIFYDPKRPGEGFPFDYNQNSAIKALTPLVVSHLSMDGGWAFVQAPFALGWIPVRDIAYVDEATAADLMASPLVVLLKDNAPVYDREQAFLFYAKSATLFPVGEEMEDFWRVSVPAGERFGGGYLPKEWSGRMPLAMTGANLRCVATALLGEPYTWGGLLQDRDCSATTRDFFLPFGIWLPRNSAQQARVGRVVGLKGLSPQEKERKIVEEGVPFRTLLYLPGHIMLYVGHQNGRAYALHNLWGIRTKEGGRILIGKTVVSDLWLGENLPDADTDALLIRRIESMNIVTE
ncbi:SH3 domain-containing protein [Hydrogenimonas sp.]